MAETIFQPILSTWVTVSLRFIDILFWLACAMWHIFLFISIVHNSSEAIYILFPVVEICSCSCSYQILSTPFVYHNTRTLVTRVCVCVWVTFVFIAWSRNDDCFDVVSAALRLRYSLWLKLGSSWLSDNNTHCYFMGRRRSCSANFCQTLAMNSKPRF